MLMNVLYILLLRCTSTHFPNFYEVPERSGHSAGFPAVSLAPEMIIFMILLFSEVQKPYNSSAETLIIEMLFEHGKRGLKNGSSFRTMNNNGIGEWIVKRILIICLLVLCAVVCLVSCSEAPEAGAADDGAVTGKIVIYTSMYEDVIDELQTTLETRFPDLDIEFFQGGSGTIQSKIAAEMDSGRLGCDILMVAEPSYSLELKEAGILHPYSFADADKLMFDYDPEGYWYPVRVCNMVLAYNPEKYSREEVPCSFKAFAEDPSFQGKLSMSNPLTSGSAYSTVVGLLDLYGESYLEALGKQNVAIESGSVALTKLETGECRAIMVLEESVLKKRQEEGSVAVPSPIMIIDKEHSANANLAAAEAVEEYFLSPEGQQQIVKGWMYAVRSDVEEYPYDAIPLEQLLKNIVPVDWEKCFREREEIRTKFQEYVTVS